MRTADVVIVGASLSAAAAAKRLVDAGLETVILERLELPRHKICSGILSPRGHRFLLENFGPLPREALLPAIADKLRAGDLYVIASQAFNFEQARLIGSYDALRERSGCEMNLDLQRIAMPAAGQAHWILEGRRVERIVVEDLAERAAFGFAGKPVLHLAELA